LSVWRFFHRARVPPRTLPPRRPRCPSSVIGYYAHHLKPPFLSRGVGTPSRFVRARPRARTQNASIPKGRPRAVSSTRTRSHAHTPSGSVRPLGRRVQTSPTRSASPWCSDPSAVLGRLAERRPRCCTRRRRKTQPGPSTISRSTSPPTGPRASSTASRSWSASTSTRRRRSTAARCARCWSRWPRHPGPLVNQSRRPLSQHSHDRVAAA